MCSWFFWVGCQPEDKREFPCLTQSFFTFHFCSFFPELLISFYWNCPCMLQNHYNKLTTFNFPCHGRTQIKLVSDYCLTSFLIHFISVLFCLSLVTISPFTLVYIFFTAIADFIPQTIIYSLNAFTALGRLEKASQLAQPFSYH